jgi:hypothetical protein
VSGVVPKPSKPAQGKTAGIRDQSSSGTTLPLGGVQGSNYVDCRVDQVAAREDLARNARLKLEAATLAELAAKALGSGLA